MGFAGACFLAFFFSSLTSETENDGENCFVF